MTKKLWNAVGKDSKQYTCTPQALLQTVIRGADRVRYHICWQTKEQEFPELLTDAYANSNLTPNIYQGRPRTFWT